VTSLTPEDIATESIYSESEPPARVVANSAWMLLAQMVAALIGGGVSIYAIRNFTTSSWGHYSTALALVALFSVLSGAGLAPLALREMTSSPGLQATILGRTFQALAWTSTTALAALFIATAALGYPREVIVLVLLLAPSVLLDPALANLAAAFNARSRLDYVARFQIVQAVIYGASAVVVIAASLGVTGLAVATITASLCAAVLALVLLRAKLGLTLRLRHGAHTVWAFVRSAIPIAGINVVAVVYARVDIVMLSVLSTSSNVAFYTVPYGLVRLSWLLPSVVSAAFFPLLSRRLQTNRADAEYLFFLVVRVFLFLSVPISLLLALSAPTVLPLVFGDPYSHSTAVLQIMAWTSVLGFQNYILWYGVLASRAERTVFFIQMAGLVLNVAINAVAIPLYGPSGAAAALVVSDLVVISGMAILLHRRLFPIPVVELFTKPVAAALVVVPPAVVVASHNAVGGAVAGAVAYAAILLVLRYVTWEEWRPLAAIVKAPFTLLRRGKPSAT
jgi:O-antigen/teichoic acid export membrane protein